MGRIINRDFASDCKDLTRRGYTQKQIIEKLKIKYGYKSISRDTIRRAIQNKYNLKLNEAL